MESDFLPLFTDTVTIEPFLGNDRYAQPAYGPPKAYKARVEETSKITRTLAGITTMATATIVVNTTDRIKTRDRITLADGQQPEILEASLITDEKGPHHVELTVG